MSGKTEVKPLDGKGGGGGGLHHGYSHWADGWKSHPSIPY